MRDSAWLLPEQERLQALRALGLGSTPIVWYGGPYTLHTCPVRELDPEADFYVEWMVATHQQTERGWVLQHLPESGGIGTQDARLMQGIGWARDEANAFLREQQAEHNRDRQAAEYLAQIERESRA